MFHTGVITRRLRTIAAVLGTPARFDRKQHAALDLVWLVMLAVDARSAKNERSEWFNVNRFNLRQGPIVAHCIYFSGRGPHCGILRRVKFRVRPATKADMPAIRALVRLFPNQLVQRDLPRMSSFFVAVAKGQVVGCCALQVYSKRIAEVRTLAVHPDFQDRGAATALVERCRDRARERGIKEMFAVTGQIHFFERLGFATFRREKTAMFFELGKKS